MVFFVDPDKERLVVVVEDASSIRPVPVEAASFEESVALFEEEVVFDELFLVLWGHRSKRIIFSLKLSSEFCTGLNNFLFNSFSLVFSDAWSKWEISKVAADSDSCAADHFCILSIERWTFKM